MGQGSGVRGQVPPDVARPPRPCSTTAAVLISRKVREARNVSYSLTPNSLTHQLNISRVGTYFASTSITSYTKHTKIGAVRQNARRRFGAPFWCGGPPRSQPETPTPPAPAVGFARRRVCGGKPRKARKSAKAEHGSGYERKKGNCRGCYFVLLGGAGFWDCCSARLRIMASCCLQYREPGAARRLQRLPESVVASHCRRSCPVALPRRRFADAAATSFVAAERSMHMETAAHIRTPFISHPSFSCLPRQRRRQSGFHRQRKAK